MKQDARKNILMDSTSGYNVSEVVTHSGSVTHKAEHEFQPLTSVRRSHSERINSTETSHLLGTPMSNLSTLTTELSTQNMQEMKQYGDAQSAASTLLLPSLFGIFVMFSLILVTICARRQRKNILSQWRKEQLGSYTRGMGWTTYTPNAQNSPGSTTKVPKPNASSHPLADSAKRYLNSMIKKTSGRSHGRNQADGETSSPRPGHSRQSIPSLPCKLSKSQDNSAISTNV